MPIIQDNPFYFEESVQPLDMRPVFYKKYGFLPGENHHPQDKPRRTEPLSSEDTDANELDVFLSSCESNESGAFSSTRSYNGHPPIKETCFGSNTRIPLNERRGSGNTNSEQRKGFSQKLGQFFWKSKSKHSLGSESHVSGSTNESNGPNSPRFTPDSSLSIYTNSLEGDRDSTNSSNSNQISPKDEVDCKVERARNFSTEDEGATHYRFDDCARYAANMYYNMGEYTCSVQQSRPRNNSVPIANSEAGIIRDNTNAIQDYYMNPTFSTFPNPRRHSIAYSSGSSGNTCKSSKKGKQKKQHQIIDIKQDKDGYLRPNEPRNSKNLRNAYYINEPESPSAESSKVQVHVDVHTPTPTSPSSLNYSEFEALNSSGRGRIGRDFETSVTTVTDDSQSTVLAGSICSGSYVPFYQNGAGALSFEAGNKCQPIHNEGKISNENIGRSGSKFAPVCLSRIRRVIGSDCEPYCSLCGVTSTMVASTFKSKMDVAIVSCHECFFSKNAETHIRGFMDKLVTPDKQKMDVKLKSYDLKDLEHSKSAADVHQCKVQIVIISHHFLQRLKLEASTRLRVSPVNRVFRSKRVIAILAGGVNHKEVTDGYQMVFARFGEWFCVELRSTCKLDLDFSKKFTEHFIKIYNLEQCNTSNFSVFPKKVTRDQPKVVVLLKKPVEGEDEVRVEFACGRKTEVSTFTKIENPFTLSVRLPDNLCPEKIAYVEISVYLNGQKLGATCIKSDLQARVYDEDVLEKMTSMVPGFLKLFDEHIKQTLIRNYRECTDFLTDPSIELMNDVLICKGDEFPTIMHFAAYYGLEHTAFTVLDEADGLEQCKLVNDNDMKPLDLAEYRNHEHVVQIIKDYHLHQEISASCKAYQMIKNIYSRDSVLELQKKEIVSKSRSIDKANAPVLPAYENLPETAITESESIESQETHLMVDDSPVGDDQKSCSSGGSYITWNFNQAEKLESINSQSDSANATPVEKIKKPKPVVRSSRPKQKKDYVNVESENLPDISETNADQEVRLRRPREGRVSRDHLRRKSISPNQNYSVPRLTHEEYSIPPPDARPVAVDSAEIQPRGDNSPVFVKKTVGSIPITTDGYLIMDHEDDNGDTVLKEHLRYEEGNFISITPAPERGREFQSAIFNPLSLNRMDSLETPPTSPEAGKIHSDNSEYMASSTLKQERKMSQTTEPNITLDPVDEELIHLMKDFTSAGYTTQQIELLFENWKCRPDVMRSIEDKKIYMKKVREEYKRLQGQTTKGASLLDKIKVVLTGKKKVSVTTAPKLEHLGGAKLSLDDIHKLQTRPSADRDSVGSHGSGSVNSVPDSGVSGVSEQDTEREKERDKEPFPGYDTNSPKMYRNPLDRRFIPSYVPRDPPTFPLHSPAPTENGTSPVSSPGPTAEYQIPPPPRPLTVPPVPQKPARNNLSESTSPENRAIDNSTQPEPPALPQKPSHLRGNVQQEDDDIANPPPPPPRTYIKPNPFNYIDYSQRNRGDLSTGNGKPAARSPSPYPYDNLKEDQAE